MADYIDREAFIADKRAQYCDNCDRRKGMKNGKMRFVYEIGDAPCRACGVGDMMDDIEDYPAADAVEVKRGRWIESELDKDFVTCSVCKTNKLKMRMAYRDDYAKIFNYCPNCGAKMEGDHDQP